MDRDTSLFWSRRLALQGEDSTQPLRALTAERQLKGQCKSVVFLCEDDGLYAVKGRQVGRPLIADRIVGLLGNLVESPVPDVQLIEVAKELCDYPESYCYHFDAGLAHGSRWIEDCEEDVHVRWPDDPGNRERFSDLAVLYGATLSSDQQFLYKRSYPHTVWSHDHGPFLDIESTWDEGLLSYYLRGNVYLNPHILVEAQCSKSQLGSSAERICSISEEKIASVVGSIPTAWGLSDDERINLCEFIRVSRDRVIKQIKASAA